MTSEAMDWPRIAGQNFCCRLRIKAETCSSLGSIARISIVAGRTMERPINYAALFGGLEIVRTT
jgi:hypothetical protein